MKNHPNQHSPRKIPSMGFDQEPPAVKPIDPLLIKDSIARLRNHQEGRWGRTGSRKEQRARERVGNKRRRKAGRIIGRKALRPGRAPGRKPKKARRSMAGSHKRRAPKRNAGRKGKARKRRGALNRKATRSRPAKRRRPNSRANAKPKGASKKRKAVTGKRAKLLKKVFWDVDEKMPRTAQQIERCRRILEGEMSKPRRKGSIIARKGRSKKKKNVLLCVACKRRIRR